MKSYSSREIIKALEADGWYEITVKHPNKDIPIKTLKRIEEQSGLKFK